MAVQFCQAKGISQRRACTLVSLARSSARYSKKTLEPDPLVSQLSKLREANPRFGSRRLHALLKREGETVNYKRVERLVRMNHLQVARKKRPRVPIDKKKTVVSQALYPHHVWTIDFQEDALINGKKVKILNILDEFTREWLLGEASFSSSAEWVKSSLSTLFSSHGVPHSLRSDNGSEFIAHLMKNYLVESGSSASYIDPGKPWQNGIVESFHGKLRDEFLNRECFSSVLEMNVSLQVHRRWYNEERPHSSLQYRTPLAYRREKSKERESMVLTQQMAQL
jgi:putative transposase